MRKFLLSTVTMLCVSVFMWGQGGTTIQIIGSGNGIGLQFNVNNDPDLTSINWVVDHGDHEETVGGVSTYHIAEDGGVVKFKGESSSDVVNASAIEELVNAQNNGSQAWYNYRKNGIIDVSEIALNGEISTLPLRQNNDGYAITGLVYTNNEALPSWVDGSVFMYALSNGSTDSYLYASTGQTALPSNLTINTTDVTYHLTGEGATAMKTLLMNADVPESNIDMSSAASYTSTINCAGNAITFDLGDEGGNLASAIEKAADLFGKNTSLRHVKIIGTINAEDLTALKDFNFTNGESIDLSKVTLSPTTLAETGNFSFSGTDNNPNLKYVILPKNVDEIDQTWFTKLTNLNAAITYSYDATANSTLQAYVNTPNTLAETIVRLAADKCNQYEAEPDEDLDVTFATGNSGKNGINLSQKKNNDGTYSGKTVNAVKISGHVSARDISNNNGNQKPVFDENGHFVFNNTSVEAASQERSLVGTEQLCALAGANNVVSFDLGGAYIENEHIDDLTLSYGGVLGTNTKEVVIPTDPRVVTLPADFMNMSHGVFQICIPANIKNIKTRAFNKTQIDHIWTTSTDPTIKTDNGIVTAVNENGDATVTQTGQLPLTTTRSDYMWGTYTFPAGLELIESYAFGSNEQSGSRVKDVYVLATTAPECHVNAFPPVMYHGNNGFKKSEITAEGIITRDAYRQDNNSYNWITMLHFPRETRTPNVQRYTDPTRVYSIATGDVDGNGSPIYYPNQCEMDRAFQQGTTGYLWNAWDPTRDDDGSNAFENTTIDRYNLTVYYYTPEGQNTANGVYVANTTTDAATKQWTSFYDVTAGGLYSQPDGLIPYDQVYRKNSQFTTNSAGATQLYPTGQDYRGWHQFVLTGYAHNSNLEFEPLKSYITDSDWWTICAPYNLRYSDIMLLFGDRSHPEKLPYLSKLLYVVRDVKNRKITLMFSKNLMQYKEVEPGTSTSINEGSHVHGEITDANMWDTDGLGTGTNNPVILHAGVPYLIKPYLPDNANRQFDVYRSEQAEGLSIPSGAIIDDWLYNSFAESRSLSGEMQKDLIYRGEYQVPAYVINNVSGSVAEKTLGAGVAMPVVLNDESEFNYTPTGFSYNGVSSAEISNEYTYTFVGTFYLSLMPQYCYFLGWDSANSRAAFWYNKHNDPANYTWNNETGVICPNWSLTHTITAASTAKGAVMPARWEAIAPTNITSDDFNDPSLEAKGYMEMTFGNSMWLDDLGVATGIVEKTASIDDGIVYDVHGVKVGKSLEGLSKGVYVLNGKKYVVK